MKLEHMQMRWRVQRCESGRNFEIVTDETLPWFIAELHDYIAEDDTGELTARAICDEHNKALEGKK